jgi:hypothetical protein
LGVEELAEAEAVFAAHLHKFYAHAFAGFHVVNDGAGAQCGAQRNLNNDFDRGAGSGRVGCFQEQAAQTDGA